MQPPKVNDEGFALIAVLLMMAVLLSLLSAYTVISRVELSTTKSSNDSVRGFYAAEAGLNLRAEQIRDLFEGYNRPDGEPPLLPGPCQDANMGSGSYACQEHDLAGHRAVTYITEDPANPQQITIPPGELYQNLNAQEFRYTVTSQAVGPHGDIEAMLELRFKSRLVPLFQFAAFYNKDLEILPGPHMDLEGPVHVNGDLYLNSDTGGLDISGQITVGKGDAGGGSLYRGRKNNNACSNVPVRIKDPLTLRSLKPGCSSRTKIQSTEVVPWNGMIRLDVPQVIVPEPEDFDPEPGKFYWDVADLRLALRMTSSNNFDNAYSVTGVEVRRANGAVDAAATNLLHACTGSVQSAGLSGTRAIGRTNTFHNNRENRDIRMLEVDVRALLNCLHTTNWLNTGLKLDDDSQTGLIIYLTVFGPNSGASSSGYGVRLRNGSELQSDISGSPLVRGMTVVTDQALYVHGNYNSVNKIPAGLFSDSFNVLSQDWVLNPATENTRSKVSSSSDVNNYRRAGNTTINAGILSGTDSTGNAEGTGGQGGGYNGGLENYPRFHERWTGRTLTYYGSWVSLNRPRHVDGDWIYGSAGGKYYYEAPDRNWHYDTDFNNANNLPPVTPQFVYLRQELFMRDFER